MTESKRKQGFALLTPERMREVASMGGIVAHQQGRAHKFTPEEARKAAFASAAAKRARKEAK